MNARNPPMKSRLRHTVFAFAMIAIGILISLSAFAAWVKMYPEDVDPKNIDYVLWTHGFNQNMNLDHALDAMTHDKRPESLVLGLSKQQIEERFGFVQAPDQNPRGCHAWGPPASLGEGKESVSLRDSRWVVLLHHDKAVDLRLCKG